jgi:probable phosphoglycerate mutase
MTGNLFGDAPESAPGWYTAHCDGGSRGNPGPAGFGAVIEDPEGQVAARLSQFLGTQTNNYAEYSGLLAVLEWALKHAVKRLRVVSDSELLVRQMKGQYKVKNAGLRPLWEEARRRAGWLERFEMRHTLRGGNQEADRLANEAMDRGMGKANRDRGTGIEDRGTERVPPPGSARAGADGPANRQAGGSTSRRTRAAAQPKASRQTLSGYVKDGVVHLLDGELPEEIFVKVTRED